VPAALVSGNSSPKAAPGVEEASTSPARTAVTKALCPAGAAIEGKGKFSGYGKKGRNLTSLRKLVTLRVGRSCLLAGQQAETSELAD
jgi:hypothetical protein